MSSRASAITVPGIVLSQPLIATMRVEQVAAGDQLDRVGDHLARDERALIPLVPIVIPSEIAIVLNSIGVPPAARMPSLTFAASTRWLKLHGIVSIHDARRRRSASRGPRRRSRSLQVGARGGARGPSVRARLRCLTSNGGAHGTENLIRPPVPAPWLSTAVYLLWMVARLVGKVTNEKNKTLGDLSWREIGLMVPLLFLMVYMGVYPKPIL